MLAMKVLYNGCNMCTLYFTDMYALAVRPVVLALHSQITRAHVTTITCNLVTAYVCTRCGHTAHCQKPHQPHGRNMPGFLKLHLSAKLMCVSIPSALINMKYTCNNQVNQIISFAVSFMTLDFDKMDGCRLSNILCCKCLPKNTKVMQC